MNPGSAAGQPVLLTTAGLTKGRDAVGLELGLDRAGGKRGERQRALQVETRM